MEAARKAKLGIFNQRIVNIEVGDDLVRLTPLKLPTHEEAVDKVKGTLGFLRQYPKDKGNFKTLQGKLLKIVTAEYEPKQSIDFDQFDMFGWKERQALLESDRLERAATNRINFVGQPSPSKQLRNEIKQIIKTYGGGDKLDFELEDSKEEKMSLLIEPIRKEKVLIRDKRFNRDNHLLLQNLQKGKTFITEIHSPTAAVANDRSLPRTVNVFKVKHHLSKIVGQKHSASRDPSRDLTSRSAIKSFSLDRRWEVADSIDLSLDHSVGLPSSSPASTARDPNKLIPISNFSTARSYRPHDESKHIKIDLQQKIT